MTRRAPAFWNNLPLGVKGVTVVAIPTLCLILSSSFFLWMQRKHSEAALFVDRSHQVQQELELFLRLSIDAETAVRGYVLTRRASFLEPLKTARAQLPNVRERLRGLIINNELRDGFERLNSLQESQMAWVNKVERTVVQTHHLSEEETQSTFDEGKRVLDTVRSAADQVNEIQRRVLNSRRQEMQRLTVWAEWSTVGLLILGGFVGVLATRLLFTGIVKRVQILSENARLMEQGKPMFPLTRYRDEIGSLAARMMESSRNLQIRDAELRSSEQQFRSLFENAPIPYLETDRSGIITRVNRSACSLLGLKSSELLGSQFVSLLPFGERKNAENAIRTMLNEERQISTFQLNFTRSDGSLVPADVYDNVIRDQDGRISGFRAALLDITQRIRAVEVEKEYAEVLQAKNEDLAAALDAAEEASSHKTKFLANMSHELRTPLNGIIGFSEILQDGGAGPVNEVQTDFLKDILGSARHLLNVINDLLDLSKVEAGRMVFRPEEVDLRQIVEDTADSLLTVAASRSICVNLDVKEDARNAYLDGGKFRQVLYNFLSNGLKFTPEHGTVTVRIFSPQQESIVLETEDTGIGISDEDLPRLFQEFEQLEGGMNKRFQGTGLGLALTKRLVEAQGGEISVKSKVGKGSTFRVVLPRRMSNQTTEGVGSRISFRNKTQKTENKSSLMQHLNQALDGAPSGSYVLVVDDDPQALKLANAALEELNQHAILSSDGQEGLATAKKGLPKAVILDLLMPRLNGFEFLLGFRSLRGASSIPVIIWTNMDLEAIQHETLERQVQGIVPKSSGGLQQLIAEMKKVLGDGVSVGRKVVDSSY